MTLRLPLVALLIISPGCAKVAHINELMTLKAYSDNQDAQHRYVEKQAGQFEKLLAAVEDGSISQYKNQRSFLTHFGEPVLSRDVERNGQSCVLWLYRYAVRAATSPKVYLYFDQKKDLIGWEYDPPEMMAQSDVP